MLASMEDALIPRTRRRAYLGHLRSLDQSDDYERHEITAYLQQDANSLREALLPHSEVFPDRMCSLP